MRETKDIQPSRINWEGGEARLKPNAGMRFPFIVLSSFGRQMPWAKVQGWEGAGNSPCTAKARRLPSFFFASRPLGIEYVASPRGAAKVGIKDLTP